MRQSRSKGFELRKSVRLPTSLPVKFRLFDISTRKSYLTSIYGRTHNISVEGLCLETNTAMADNCEIFLSCLKGDKQLQLEVELPNVTPPLHLWGKVLWYDGQLPGSPYQFSAGISITEATEHNRTLWQKYVEEHKGKWFTESWWFKAWSKIFPKSE